MIDHRSYAHNLNSCEIKAWKKSGLNGIRTHDLCDTGAALYQLSYQVYQAIWELVTLWVRNIPVTSSQMELHSKLKKMENARDGERAKVTRSEYQSISYNPSVISHSLYLYSSDL